MARKKIKSPITSGVCKVPVVMQLEALECGAAALTMILAYYNKWIPLEQVRSDCGVSRDGSNAKRVLLAARHYGLKAKGYRFETKDLMQEGRFPCIIHWNFNHFVVLCGFRNGKAYLNDPAKGAYSVPLEDFDDAFTGICIFAEPGDDFVPSGKPKSMISFAKKRLKGTGGAMLFCILTAFIGALLNTISPGFSRIFLDRLLSGKDPGWLAPFIVVFAVFTVVETVMSAIGNVYSLKISGKMAAVGNASFMWKILKSPISFFSQRMAGDIQERKESNATIATILMGTFAPLFVNIVMMIVYFFVMLRYSPLLTFIGLFSIAVNTAVSRFVSKKRVNITRIAMRDSANLVSNTVAGIEMIETIKSSGAENAFFSKWSGYQASVNTQNVKLLRLNQYLGTLPVFISSVANNAVLVIGVLLTIEGQFTVGMIMAFQGFLTSFMTPASTLIEAGQTLLEMRTQMERVEDVMEYPDDDIITEIDGTDGDAKKLSGRIEIKDLTFGYSKLDAPIIKYFNLTVEPGKSVAIVGGSGCGKSTMSKLISGLYRPWSGEILFDGKTMAQIDKGLFYSSVAVVDQDVILFEDTVANNIKMWDDSIEDFEMILAAKDAQLHSDILARDGGYSAKLTEGGRDLSGGQRQRLEIARVLAEEPTVIILDEATSALDAKTEYEVVKAIRNRGITTVVIAHRLSTIRSCDEIVVMDHGQIVDRGTHRELMEKCDLYRELVTSE